MRYRSRYETRIDKIQVLIVDFGIFLVDLLSQFTMITKASIAPFIEQNKMRWHFFWIYWYKFHTYHVLQHAHYLFD